MSRKYVFAVAKLFLTATLAKTATGQSPGGPQTVLVHNKQLSLRALLWRPQGPGSFPAILLNHGSSRTQEELKRLEPYEGQADILGPVFARHGYVFLFLFRRGVGPSAGQGTSAIDLMNNELAARGQEARNARFGSPTCSRSWTNTCGGETSEVRTEALEQRPDHAYTN